MDGTERNEAPAPLVVTMVAGQGTGPGTLETPFGQPNVIVKVIEPLAIIAVRAFKAFLDTMLGVMTAGPVTGLIPAKDFGHLVVVAASLSVGAAGFSIIRSMIELLARFDQSHPTLAK